MQGKSNSFIEMLQNPELRKTEIAKRERRLNVSRLFGIIVTLLVMVVDLLFFRVQLLPDFAPYLLLLLIIFIQMEYDIKLMKMFDIIDNRPKK